MHGGLPINWSVDLRYADGQCQVSQWYLPLLGSVGLLALYINHVFKDSNRVLIQVLKYLNLQCCNSANCPQGTLCSSRYDYTVDLR